MTDFSPPAPTYADPDPVGRRRHLPATTGSLFDKRDTALFIAIAVINLAPLAMGALWVPYH